MPNRAYGYVSNANGFAFSDQNVTSAVLGDGGIYSSVVDLFKWDQALYTEKLVGKKWLAEAFTPHSNKSDFDGSGYGFGWYLGKYRGTQHIWHYGSTCGFSTQLERFPEKKLTVIILTNRRGAKISGLPQKIADALLVIGCAGGDFLTEPFRFAGCKLENNSPPARRRGAGGNPGRKRDRPDGAVAVSAEGRRFVFPQFFMNDLNVLNRRGFLARASAVSLLTLATPSALFAQNKGPSFCAFEKPLQFLSYEELADVLAERGLDGVEATVRPGGHVLPERVAEDLPRLHRALKNRGLEITVMTTGINSIDSPHAEKVLRTAADLGIKRYRMLWYQYDLQQPILPQLESIRPKLGKLAALNRQLGLTALYQNHAGRKNGRRAHLGYLRPDQRF